jgi:predicted enzyme related to lactoylglutathione lyase
MEARHFYGICLGLPLLTDALDQGYLIFQAGSCNLIVEALQASHPEANGLLGRFVGLSFRVDDIDATFEALQRRGVQFAGQPTRSTSSAFAHFYDPTGNVLTLVGTE